MPEAPEGAPGGIQAVVDVELVVVVDVELVAEVELVDVVDDVVLVVVEPVDEVVVVVDAVVVVHGAVTVTVVPGWVTVTVRVFVFGFFFANDAFPATAIDPAKPARKSASRAAFSFK